MNEPGLIVVATLYDRVAAEIARGRLEAAGIGAIVFDGGIASVIGPGVSGVRLMVEASDEDDARALLEDCT